MFLSLSQFLKKRLQSYNFKGEIEKIEIMEVWEKIFSNKFKTLKSKRHILAKPLFFKQGVLYIKTSNSSLSQELQLQKEKLKDQINEALGKEAVKNIVFKV